MRKGQGPRQGAPIAPFSKRQDVRDHAGRGVHDVDRVAAVDVVVVAVEVGARDLVPIGQRDVVQPGIELIARRKSLTAGEDLARLARRQAAIVLFGQARRAAAAEPHEVRLAEAYCTEGCCGALYVTVVQDGDTVVWRDWRGHTTAAPPPEVRFAAEEYEAELTRAETDHTWEWPARTVARLLRTRLTAQPDLLTRWNCQPSWTWARAHEPSQVRFTFYYPEQPKLPDAKPWLQFERVIAVDGTPATDQAARVIEQLEMVDPKTQAAVVGGHRDHAEQLGYTWPVRKR